MFSLFFRPSRGRRPPPAARCPLPPDACRRAPAAGRLPAGPVSVNVLTNASSLGRDAGVLLREYVPQYMTELLAFGVFQIGPEDERLSDQYELLLADTQIRRTMDHVRRELKLYPRLQRQSVRLSAYGLALWQDCRPTPPAREEGTPAVR